MHPKISAIRRFLPVRLLIVTAALILIYLLAGFQLLPVLAERYVPRYAAEQLQRKASVGEVRFNPILLILEVRDFSLSEPDGTPILGFRRLLLDFELSSIFRWAWTFATITLDGLDVRAEIRPDGRLNLLELVDALARSDSQPNQQDTAPPRVLLRHAVLGDGMFALSDRSGARPAQATVGPVSLELRDISTLPELRGPYTVSARLPGGGVFNWRGEASLQPIFSSGEVSLRGLRPAAWWGFLREHVNLAEPEGQVDFSMHYRLDYADGNLGLGLDKITLKAGGLALTKSESKEPMLSLDSIEVANGRFDLATRELVLPAIEIRKGRLDALTDAAGALNWLQLAPPAAPAAADAEPAAPAALPGQAGTAPWRVKLDAVRIEDVALHYSDRSRKVPIAVSAGALTAGFAAELALGAGAPQARVSALTVGLARVAGGEAGAAEPLVVLDSIALDGGALDLEQRSLTIRQAKLAGLTSSIVRDKQGAVRIAEVLGAHGSAQPAAQPPGTEGRPWQFALDALDMEGVKLALADHAYAQPIAYDVQNLRIGLRNIRNDGKTPVKFDAVLGVAQGGTLALAGDASQAGDRVSLRATIRQFTLKPLQPLVAARTALSLASGDVSASVKVDYRAAKDGPQLRLAGPLSVDNLLLNETSSGERLVEWKSLATDNLSLSLAPDRLAVGEVRLAGLGAKVVVFKDRSFNLVKAFAPPGTPASEVQAAPKVQASTAKPAPASTADDAATQFPVSVERIRLEKAVVDFADLSLVLPFGARVHELDGVISGISTDRASRTAVQLEGRVDEYGLARVEGGLSPFSPKTYTDIAVIFRNVEMPALSPYSATFAGRRIASGRLALDLRYKIENSQLAGDNKVVLEKFTLGERVEAPGALSLPLDLAIAVMTDADGKIDLAVPVRGNVDNPEFSYGHLVWQAIVNVLTRIVTAPFRALGALFGGGDAASFDSIGFDPGRAVLLPPEQEKLKQVAAVLGKRPQLKLAVQGAHAEKDRQALQQRAMRVAVADKLGRKPVPGQEPVPLNLGEARTQRALEQIFVERNSESALAAFVMETAKKRGKDVERVNPVLVLVGRASADVSFYEALLRRLEQAVAIADDVLRQLADARAQAVIGNLSGVHAMPAARLELRRAAAGSAGELPQAKLILDAVAAASAQSPAN